MRSKNIQDDETKIRKTLQGEGWCGWGTYHAPRQHHSLMLHLSPPSPAPHKKQKKSGSWRLETVSSGLAPSPSDRRSLLAHCLELGSRHELHRRGVHAVSQPGWRGAVVEDVTEVRPALGVHDLHPRHEEDRRVLDLPEARERPRGKKEKGGESDGGDWGVHLSAAGQAGDRRHEVCQSPPLSLDRSIDRCGIVPHLTWSGAMGAQKEGHPVPESNFALESKRGSPDTALT